VLLLCTLFRKFHVTSITCKPSHPSDTLTPPPHANPTELSFNPKTKTKPSNRNKTDAKKKPQTVCNRNKTPEKEPPAQRGKYLIRNFQQPLPSNRKKESLHRCFLSLHKRRKQTLRETTPKKKNKQTKKPDRGNYKTHKVISKLQRLCTTIKRIPPLRSEESKSLREVAQETVAVL
jgi:hypothetical protein